MLSTSDFHKTAFFPLHLWNYRLHTLKNTYSMTFWLHRLHKLKIDNYCSAVLPEMMTKTNFRPFLGKKAIAQKLTTENRFLFENPNGKLHVSIFFEWFLCHAPDGLKTLNKKNRKHMQLNRVVVFFVIRRSYYYGVFTTLFIENSMNPVHFERPSLYLLRDKLSSVSIVYYNQMRFLIYGFNRFFVNHDSC